MIGSHAIPLPQIERDVPFPKIRPRRERNGGNKPKWRELLLKMRHGESFVTRCIELHAVMTEAKKHNIFLIAEAQRSQRNDPVRIWRKDPDYEI